MYPWILFIEKHPVQRCVIYLPIYTQCARKFKLLPQMYLKGAELNQLFISNINDEQQPARLTLKALLETTSTPQNNFIIYSQKHVKLTSSLP